MFARGATGVAARPMALTMRSSSISQDLGQYENRSTINLPAGLNTSATGANDELTDRRTSRKFRSRAAMDAPKSCAMSRLPVAVQLPEAARQQAAIEATLPTTTARRRNAPASASACWAVRQLRVFESSPDEPERSPRPAFSARGSARSPLTDLPNYSI